LNHAFLYVDANKRDVWHIPIQGGSWIVHTLNDLMAEDPNFLKYDINFFLAE